MENLCINARLHLLSGTPTDEQPGWHRTAALGWSKHIERQTGSYERVPPPLALLITPHSRGWDHETTGLWAQTCKRSPSPSFTLRTTQRLFRAVSCPLCSRYVSLCGGFVLLCACQVCLCGSLSPFRDLFCLLVVLSCFFCLFVAPLCLCSCFGT